MHRSPNIRLMLLVAILVIGVFSSTAALSAPQQSGETGKISVVVTSDGLVTQAEVTLRKDDSYVGEFTCTGTGHFEIEASPGHYDVCIFAFLEEGFCEHWLHDVQCTSGETTSQRVELGTLGTLVIKILAGGAPPEEFEVIVSNARGTDVACLQWNDEEQAFEGRVVEGVYSARIRPMDSSLSEAVLKNITVSGGARAEHTASLEPLTKLCIKVTSGAEPLGDVYITAQAQSGDTIHFSYDEDSQHFWADVVSGAYTVTVKPCDTVFEPQTITAHTDSVSTVQFPALTQVVVDLRGVGGLAYPLADIDVKKDGERISSLYWNPAISAYEGRLPEGTYDIAITPDGYYAPRQLAGAALTGETNRFHLELLKNRTRRVDTNEVISRDELIAIARRYKGLYYPLIAFEARSSIDKELKRLENESAAATAATAGAATDTATGTGSHVADELTSLAVLLGAKAIEKEISITLSAAAVIAAPENELVVANFGALLRLLRATEDSVKVLNYACMLAPRSAMTLTNLGNSVFELGDDETAEELFMRAIEHQPKLGDAHTSLSSLYLMRGDVQRAIEHAFKAAVCGAYTPALRKSITEARSAGASMKSIPPPPPPPPAGAVEPDVGSAEGGTPDVNEELQIPRLPSWPSWEALVASAQHAAEWSNDIVENGLIKPIDVGMGAYRTMTVSPGIEKAYGGVYSQLAFEIECYGYYLQDRVLEVYDKYQKDVDVHLDAWTRDMERILGAQADAFDFRGAYTPAAFKAALLKADAADQEAFRLRAVATSRLFNAWKPLYLNAYEEIARLVEEYWIYTESPASRIYDSETADYIGFMRRSSVYSSFVPLALELPARIVLFEISGGPPLMRPPGERLKDVPEPIPSDTPKVPPPKKGKCPFSGGRAFVADLGLASMQVDCETVEVKMGQGFQVGGTYNFKHKYVSSLYTGVGVSGKAGIAHLEASAGLRANFGPNNEVLGITPVGDAGAKLSGAHLSGGVTTNGLVVGVGPFSITGPSR